MNAADRLGKLPNRAQRAIAILILPAALLAIWAGLIWPVCHLYDEHAEWREHAARTLARQRGLAKIEREVRAQLDSLPQLASWQRFYRAHTQGDAMVALQADISALLLASKARPQSFTPIDSPAQTAAARATHVRNVGIRVGAAMTIEQLAELMRRVSELGHFVRIEKLVVLAPPLQSAEENPTLTVTLDVIGFALDDTTLERATLARREGR